MADDATLRCAACEHDISYDDDVRTIGGRRFHATCAGAPHDDEPASGAAVSILARLIERVSRALSR